MSTMVNVPLCNIIYDDNFKPELNVIKKKKINIDNYDTIKPKLKLLKDMVALDKLAYEQSYIISCDICSCPKAIMCISSGDFNKSNVYWRNIGMFLLLSGAEQAIIVHNHPANTRGASKDDKGVAIKFMFVCNMFDIIPLGSYVITRNGYTNVADDVLKRW